jgi:hypothetical protein
MRLEKHHNILIVGPGLLGNRDEMREMMRISTARRALFDKP